MRYRLLASYQGAPFEAGVGPEETGVVLFAACPPPEDLRFEPATGHWRKQVDRAEVQTLYESRPVGTFRGERCVVLDDLTDRLHIAYLGHDAYRAEQLGYWEVDRGVFELITPRQEVTEIVEQRLPVAAPGESPPRPHPVPPAGSRAGPGGEQANGSRPHLPSPDGLSGPERLAPGRQELDDYLQGIPQYSGSAPADRPAQAADDAPLPLEAEAMRAARKAKQDQHPQPGSPPVPAAPAGLSEPSSALPPRADSASSVPSWSPQSHVPAQRPSHAETTDTAGQRVRSGLGQAGEQPAVPHQVAPPPQVPRRAAPDPVPGDPAIHGAPLPAPAGPPIQAPPGQPPVSQAVPPAGSTPPGHGQPPPALQRGAPAPPEMAAPPQAAPPRPGPAQGGLAQDVPQPPGGSAPSAPAAPGAVPGSRSISNSPEGGTAPAAAGSQVNGMYLGGQATAGTSVPGQGLPRDQFERPIPGPAVAGPLPGPSGYPGSATVATSAAGGMTGQASVGVAVADPVLTVPYPPVAPAAHQAPPPAATSASRSEPAESAEAHEAHLPVPRRRRASRRRLPTQRIFSDLAAQAGIPPGAYAINEDVDGAMCLVRTGEGFEVFNSLAGARHEVRVFGDEESAYFYLFGVLAAEAVRTGMLGPAQ